MPSPALPSPLRWLPSHSSRFRCCERRRRTVIAQQQRPGSVPAVASAAAVASQTESKAAAAIANARALDPYFAAHRELTGGSPLPRATAYLRPGAGEP